MSGRQPVSSRSDDRSAPSSARPAQALRFNRQRSILTTISLAWGVACFVILYSYGDGFHLRAAQAPSARWARTWC